ncbi:MAG: hypothetical protein M1818_007651 [Claussenomyces sp. TS43310]|nr:MAG: hypothetical protein M1818_007651 [Claussenomyces sp. TS43310]
MAPTVILIRHAEAEHSLGPQCQELNAYLKNHVPLAERVELIVSSPMRRTLQTATQSLDWLIARGVPVVLRAEWQENSDKPCDTGTSIADMRQEWPQFSWDSVDPDYPSKSGLYEFSKDGLLQRGIEARRWLKSRPEKVIAVVSHSGFLRVGVSFRKYENADFRVFEFAAGNEFDDVGGKLVEWEMTATKGGGLGKSPPGIFDFDPADVPGEARTRRELSEAVSERPEREGREGKARGGFA